MFYYLFICGRVFGKFYFFIVMNIVLLKLDCSYIGVFVEGCGVFVYVFRICLVELYGSLSFNILRYLNILILIFIIVLLILIFISSEEGFVFLYIFLFY